MTEENQEFTCCDCDCDCQPEPRKPLSGMAAMVICLSVLMVTGTFFMDRNQERIKQLEVAKIEQIKTETETQLRHEQMKMQLDLNMKQLELQSKKMETK